MLKVFHTVIPVYGKGLYCLTSAIIKMLDNKTTLKWSVYEKHAKYGFVIGNRDVHSLQ